MNRPACIFVEGERATNADGELIDITGEYLLSLPTHVISIGRNQFPYWAKLAQTLEGREGRDHGWLISVDRQDRRTKSDRARGIFGVQRLSYRYPKTEHNADRKRPPAKVVSLLNVEYFTEAVDIRAAGFALIEIAERRGVRPRFTPGSLGGAMLRASVYWDKHRRPAPHFISEESRPLLPGNHYETRRGYRKAARAFYIDQKSSHHTIAATIDLPHPHHLHRRGERTDGGHRRQDQLTLADLNGHIGVFLATVTIAQIPDKRKHLYPKWCQEPGTRRHWIWTPELRILDDRIRVERVHTAFTSVHPDPAIREYARWALDQLSGDYDPAIKPALLAAYGVLARRAEPITIYTKGEKLRKGGVTTSLPLIGKVNRYQIGGRRVPTTQNVAARGIIESETRTRSIEMARRLEDEGKRVVHIYADGLIVQTDCLPFLPPFWRTVGALTNVTSPTSNQILSRELVRLPGIPNGRRSAYIPTDEGGSRLRQGGPIYDKMAE